MRKSSLGNSQGYQRLKEIRIAVQFAELVRFLYNSITTILSVESSWLHQVRHSTINRNTTNSIPGKALFQKNILKPFLKSNILQ